MKTIIALLFALVGIATAQEPNKSGESTKKVEATDTGEREGAATILHRDDVLHDRGRGKHLWPLLDTPEARVNYFEVTGRGPLHFHPDADHRPYVLEGAVLVTCGTTTTKCVTARLQRQRRALVPTRL